MGLRNRTHGLNNTPIYNLWHCVKQRCYYKKHIGWKHYGGKGIKMCDSWRDDFKSFYDWCIDNGYKKGLTIDRIDSNGNYCPENCRFVTYKIQGNNRCTNVFLEYENERKTISQWADDERCKVNIITLMKRISSYHWDTKRAIETPKLKRINLLNKLEKLCL